MKFTATPLPGAFVIDLELVRDERGLFARSFCRNEFAALGLETTPVQCNVSHNIAAHTLRGMHYQAAPHEDAKLVSCAQGAIYDAIIDLRPGSPTYHRWFGLELTADALTMLYVPQGFAHGFLTLTAGARVLYQMFERYHPESARGVRWDDPAFAIAWPHPPSVISARDGGYPLCAS